MPKARPPEREPDHFDAMERPGKQGPRFAPIKAKRAFEEVCEQIRREVALGNLKPGDRLPPERELAEQLKVSRTAIREAMRSLENAGLVQCQQGMGGGAFIREGDSMAVTQAVRDMVMLGQIPSRNVTEARIILTEQAIRLACERATEADLSAIERDIDKSEALTLQGNFTRRNAYITEFYRVLAQATHNQVIVMLVESLSELTRSLLEKASPEPRKDFISVRRNVLRLMRARDAEGAVREMRAHLQRLDKHLERHEKMPETAAVD
ncbi:FadR family transcriptional regulator [Verticiella sediminum]|uniref:FadR family transcriptional regulator n=1 Tax=Verticiella sediminum TaxID=1247510 RepID=A0A556AJF0_9BURK|nr:FCD domain-containing protein [Verticiella sediminum]TSH93034.1 FadR family transcriptional regulator [Verticiella sediminum]